MSNDNLPDNVREGDPRAPWNAKDHLEGCPKRDGTEVCVCGHHKDPKGTEPGHRADGVCQARVPSGGLMCGCDGYEKAEHCRCAEILENRDAAKADALEGRSEGRQHDRI